MVLGDAAPDFDPHAPISESVSRAHITRPLALDTSSNRHECFDVEACKNWRKGIPFVHAWFSAIGSRRAW